MIRYVACPFCGKQNAIEHEERGGNWHPLETCTQVVWACPCADKADGLIEDMIEGRDLSRWEEEAMIHAEVLGVEVNSDINIAATAVAMK